MTFVVSQAPSGNQLRAPAADWAFGCTIVGVVVAIGLLIDWGLHADGKGEVKLAGRWAMPVTAATWAILTVLVGVFCCVCSSMIEWSPGAHRMAGVLDEEVLPLPASLELVTSDLRADCGSSGGCSAKFVVVAADGADRVEIVHRLQQHLQGLGWPLSPNKSSLHACREVGGILDWGTHCLWLYTDDQRFDDTYPRGVVVYIDNGG